MLLLNTAAALAIFAGTAVQAATWSVDVGAGGNTFTPSNLTGAASADIVVFTFKGGSHTVTQSTFADPCNPLTGGVDSNAMPYSGTGTPPTFNYTVNGTGPAWFYCKTGTHCKSGMVFAVNPTAEKTYDAFKANAMGTGTSSGSGSSGTGSSAPSSTASGSTAPAATSKAAANGRATVGVGAVAAALLFGGVSAL